MSAGEGPSGMPITCSFLIEVLGPWVCSVVKVHQAVHFSVCMLYSNKYKLRIFICQMREIKYGRGQRIRINKGRKGNVAILNRECC